MDISSYTKSIFIACSLCVLDSIYKEDILEKYWFFSSPSEYYSFFTHIQGENILNMKNVKSIKKNCLPLIFPVLEQA